MRLERKEKNIKRNRDKEYINREEEYIKKRILKKKQNNNQIAWYGT